MESGNPECFFAPKLPPWSLTVPDVHQVKSGGKRLCEHLGDRNIRGDSFAGVAATSELHRVS